MLLFLSLLCLLLQRRGLTRFKSGRKTVAKGGAGENPTISSLWQMLVLMTRAPPLRWTKRKKVRTVVEREKAVGTRVDDSICNSVWTSCFKGKKHKAKKAQEEASNRKASKVRTVLPHRYVCACLRACMCVCFCIAKFEEIAGRRHHRQRKAV